MNGSAVLVSDCNGLDRTFCVGSVLKREDGFCVGGVCRSNVSVVRDCDDGLFCNGVESCVGGVCVSGVAVNCSVFDVPGVASCFNVPDGNPLTWDFRAAFVSVCDEASRSCTRGSLNITSTCDKERCGASCVLGEVQNESCGIGGYRVRSCTASCTWGNWSDCQDQKECIPGTVESKPCGYCGTSKRSCNLNYTWTPWGECLGQGVCAPGSVQQQRCGFMLTGIQIRNCTSSCVWTSWGECTGEGECYPGIKEERECTVNGYSGVQYRNCMSNFKWSSWSGCKLPNEDITVESLRIINGDCIEPGHSLIASLDIDYSSYREGSITITAVIQELGVISRVGPIDVREKDKLSKIILLEIPEDAIPGTYYVRFTINNDYRRVRYREITVSRACGVCPDYCTGK
ncbi:MAG: hypothetical protein QXW00_04120 [Candidatus Woesearchaeota archaeon]